MTRDQIGSDQPLATTDDDRLAALVRAAAADWSMPPQRLDQTTWRDRVTKPRARRRADRLPRVAASLVAAIAVTIAVAFAAVWLGGSPSAPIAGSSVSPGATSDPSGRPTASAVPHVIVNGTLPDPARVLVHDGEDYRVVDLSQGTLGPTVFGVHSGPTVVVARPGGGWLCVCGDWQGSDPTRPARLAITLALADASGTLGSETIIRELDGRADPTLAVAGQEQLVDARTSISADGRFAFLGWAAREGADGWKLGIDVVDVAAGRVIGSSGLPKLASASADGRPVARVAPAVDLAPSGGAVLVSDFWYVASDGDQTQSGTDQWSASFDGTTVTSVTPAGVASSDACVDLGRGVARSSTVWVLCSTDGRLHVDRFGLDGTAIGSTDLPGSDGMPSARLDRTGTVLFVWQPVSMTLSRVDLGSGTVSTTTATASRQPGEGVGNLARAISRWFVPSVLAKTILFPAVAMSPDGSRIYALGVDLQNGEASGSHGVFVFDTTSLEQVGHWPPTADLTSIAVSPDGAWLYAAGQPGIGADGAATGDPASITVYATADGSVRLTAGRLGYEAVTFPGPTVP